LCPAHQADFVRVHVICDYGGIWLDSDTLVLDSLDSLFDCMEHGHGLGLQLVQEFLKKQNSELEVESSLGEGSRFYFSVPFHQNNQ
jgi:signal transduction histidine kinase